MKKLGICGGSVFAAILVTTHGLTARAQLVPGCEFPPVDEPDGDGDECFAPLTAAQMLKSLGTSTPDSNLLPSDGLEPGLFDPGQFGGDPVSLATGNVFRTEHDYRGAGAFPLMLDRTYNSLSMSAGPFGANWTHSFSARVVVLAPTVATVIRPDGKVLTFNLVGSSWVGDSDVNSRLAAVTGGTGSITGWRYTTGLDGVETYAADGRLLTVANRAGLTQALAYDSSARLVSVTDPFGRTLTITYDGQNRIRTAADPAGKVFSYAYDSNGNLTSVTYPDGSVRAYLYESTAFPHAMTGLVDENGVRLLTWAYDANGLAVSVQLVGGVGGHSFSYDFVNGLTSDTDALGHTRTFDYLTAAGVQRTLHEIKPLPGAPQDSRLYDSNGNIVEYIDFRGVVTDYTFDAARNLETSRTEAVGTAQQRTITTAWHPSFRLPIQIVETNRTTTFQYDARGDLLSATVSGINASDRTWTFQYNASGQVVQVDGPRVDEADIARFAYDTHGDLTQITDALGHVTKITAYDVHGRPLTSVDPNGLVTKVAYDARGRIISRQSGTETTQYLYDPAGQLIRLTLPDGSFLSYVYDAAHRLTGVQDSLGNRIAYTLDAAGNRRRDDVLDPAATVVRTRSRLYDAADRLTQSIGALGQVTALGYDVDDNLTSIVDPQNHLSSAGVDALNRPAVSIDPLGGTTRDALNATDDLTSLTDPLSHATLYGYDGVDEALSVASPDTGLTQSAFDAAGNVVSQTDARGLVTSLSYDALNRIDELDFSGGVVTFKYDQGPNAIGHLSQMVDGAGATTYGYDSHGRLLGSSEKLGHHTLTVGYKYDANGRLTGITYPSGLQVTLTYANGLVTQIGANGKTVISGIKYTPFGAPVSWTWANGVTYSRQMDRDGRLAGYDLGGGRSRAIVYDPAGRIVGYADSLAAQSQTFAYDAAGRLVGASGAGVSATYSYDANGNRLSLSDGSQTASYNYGGTGNRLLSVGAPAARTFTYDAAGNVVGDGTNVLTYDGLGRVIKVTNAAGAAFSYLYNGLGQRVAKLKNVTPTTDDNCDDGDNDDDDGPRAKVSRYFAYDQVGHLIAEEKANGQPSKETIYLGDIPIAVMTNDKKVSFIYSDQLDAPRAIMNQKGTIVWRWEGDPFGATPAAQDPDGDGNAFKYNLRFAGQYFDKETSYHYNVTRFYAPAIGRYLQPDTIALAGGTNLYSYVQASPASKVDRDGLCPPCLLVGIGALAFVDWQEATDAYHGQGFSSPGTYVGQAVSGAAAGAALIPGVGPGIAATISTGGAALSADLKQRVDMYAGLQHQYDIDTTVNAARDEAYVSLLAAPFVASKRLEDPFEPYAKGLLTKLSNGTIENLSVKSGAKIVRSTLVEEAPGQAIEPLYDAIMHEGEQARSSYK